MNSNERDIIKFRERLLDGWNNKDAREVME